MRVGLRGEATPVFDREPVTFEFLKDRFVIVRADTDGHTIMILAGCADHGRTANIDVLDSIIDCRVFSGNGLLERIEIHDQQVDGLDAVLLHDRLIGAAATEQAAMNDGVQGFDSAVHDFRENRSSRRLR